MLHAHDGTRPIKAAWLPAFIIAACMAPAWAGTEPAPDFVGFQGALYHAGTATPYHGAQDIEFRLYENENDPPGPAIWGERHLGVMVFSGTFNAYLGSGAAIDGVPHKTMAETFQSTGLWLGIKVGLDDEIAPRQLIHSVPTALTATTAAKAVNGVPAGTILMYAGATVPEGWLLCDGQEHDVTAYPALAAAIGNVWGQPLDSSKFKVPDMKGVTPIGANAGNPTNTVTTHGTSAGTLPARNAGAKSGTETHQLQMTEMPPHTHQYTDDFSTSANLTSWFTWEYGCNEFYTTTNRIMDNAGGNGFHNNMQPTTYVNYIIKY